MKRHLVDELDVTSARESFRASQPTSAKLEPPSELIQIFPPLITAAIFMPSADMAMCSQACTPTGVSAQVTPHN